MQADMESKFTNEMYSSIESDVLRFGYSIVKGVVPESVVDSLRTYGHSLLSEPVAEGVVWDPYIGERNKVCYSDDHFQCMYRGYAFPWNVDESRSNFEIFDALNSVRLNLARRLSENSNMQIHDIYTTWTYYPPGKGWLQKHQDSVYSNSLLLHYIIPLTFKGQDFEGGGLYMTDRDGNVVDVDSKLEKGDVLFFDGNCAHEVKLIESSGGVGRMQAFAIPSIFKYPDDSERFLGNLSMARIANIKLTKFLRAAKKRVLAKK
jgi:hypothetical protein